jgi:hypothetical protein
MNATNLFIWLVHIPSFPTLFILTPLHFPCTPTIHYAHLPIDYVNAFVDYGNTSANCTNFYANYVNKSDD